jgi:hypothetical protein
MPQNRRSEFVQGTDVTREVYIDGSRRGRHVYLRDLIACRRPIQRIGFKHRSKLWLKAAQRPIRGRRIRMTA